MSGQLVERVNAYFGHKMIDDIRLVQGVIAARPAPKPIARTRSRSRDAGGRTRRFGEGPRAPGCAHPSGRARREPAARDAGRRSAYWAPPSSRRDLARPGAVARQASGGAARRPHPGQGRRAQHPDRLRLVHLPALRQFLHRGDADPAQGVDRHRQAPADPSPLSVGHGGDPGEPAHRMRRRRTSSSPWSTLLFRKQVDWLSVGDPEVEMVKVLADQGVTPEGGPGLLRQRPAFGQSPRRRAVRPDAGGAVHAHPVHQRGELRQSRHG